MIKVLIYGVKSEYNFGGPSLIHGVRELLGELHDNYEIICYQSSHVINDAVDDFGFPVNRIPYKKQYRLLIDTLLLKFGIKPKNKARAMLLGHLASSDVVANLYGISFCSNLQKKQSSTIKLIYGLLNNYAISIAAKTLGATSVKTTGSYGPMKTKSERLRARLAAKYVFDIMVAREEESRRQMNEVAGVSKDICVSPDLANMMKVNTNDNNIKEGLVGISISHQIIRQWGSDESYITSIVALINHIIKDKEKLVLLIPNEVVPTKKYNDIHVAQDIYEQVASKERVKVLEVKQINSSQIKSEISQCEIMIASRYHTCVAALSSGIPSLVIGWHYKYEELLKHYGQEKWIISNRDCTISKLLAMYNELWDVRQRERHLIILKYPEVRKKLIQAGKIMFRK